MISDNFIGLLESADDVELLVSEQTHESKISQSGMLSGGVECLLTK